MPAYRFEALQTDGATRKGVIEADSLKAARHQLRAQSLVPLEVQPIASGSAHSDGQTLVVVDCLTLWLTNLMMPADPVQALDEAGVLAAGEALCAAVAAAPGPVVLVGNEIGLGVIPLGREVRQFVDALGRLNQSVAAACERVTLMAAGLPLTLKDKP